MSKAFDTVSRGKLLKELQEVLEPDELHIMSLLVTDVNLWVKVVKEKGENIKTEIGIAQGHSLSAVLFIFYLARSMDTEKVTDPSKKKIYFEINPQYADDITWARFEQHRNQTWSFKSNQNRIDCWNWRIMEKLA